MADIKSLGKVGMTTGGDYDLSKNYARLTCVFYNNVSWVSRKDVPAGISPGTNEAYWQKISERGGQGIQGPVGPQGNSAFDGTGVEIVNDLTTGGEAAVLSAEQGKILNTELKGLGSDAIPFIVPFNILPKKTITASTLKNGTITITENRHSLFLYRIPSGRTELNIKSYVWKSIYSDSSTIVAAVKDITLAGAVAITSDKDLTGTKGSINCLSKRVTIPEGYEYIAIPCALEAGTPALSLLQTLTEQDDIVTLDSGSFIKGRWLDDVYEPSNTRLTSKLVSLGKISEFYVLHDIKYKHSILDTSDNGMVISDSGWEYSVTKHKVMGKYFRINVAELYDSAIDDFSDLSITIIPASIYEGRINQLTNRLNSGYPISFGKMEMGHGSVGPNGEVVSTVKAYPRAVTRNPFPLGCANIIFSHASGYKASFAEYNDKGEFITDYGYTDDSNLMVFSSRLNSFRSVIKREVDSTLTDEDVSDALVTIQRMSDVRSTQIAILVEEGKSYSKQAASGQKDPNYDTFIFFLNPGKYYLKTAIWKSSLADYSTIIKVASDLTESAEYRIVFSGENWVNLDRSTAKVVTIPVTITADMPYLIVPTNKTTLAKVVVGELSPEGIDPDGGGEGSAGESKDRSLYDLLGEGIHIIGHVNGGAFGQRIAQYNSLGSAIIASRYGFKALEFDVVFTKDGIAFPCHDKYLNDYYVRTDGTELTEQIYINSLTYEEIVGSYKLKYGLDCFNFISSAEDILRFHATNGIIPVVELKNSSSEVSDEYLSSFLELIDKYCGLASTVIISFDTDLLFRIRTRAKDIHLGLLTFAVTDSQIQTAKEKNMFINAEYSNLTADIVNSLHSQRIPIASWTVTKDTLQGCIEKNIRVITCDDVCPKEDSGVIDTHLINRLDFSNVTHNGLASNGVLSISDGQSIIVNPVVDELSSVIVKMVMKGSYDIQGTTGSTESFRQILYSQMLYNNANPINITGVFECLSIEVIIQRH